MFADRRTTGRRTPARAPGRWRMHARRALRSESGLSLMELVVGLTIMTIFMTMFTGAVVMMYNTSSKTEALSDTASQLSIAFNRLDKSVRYASAINEPGQAGNDWYVEWLSTYSGRKDCTQVRVHAADNQLQQRTWSVSADGTATGLTAWVPLASGLDIGAAASPFTLNVASDAARDSAMPYQQLTFRLTAASTGRTGITTTATDVTFTAFNSEALTSGAICMEGGRG